jgi:CubicO group peptidase (beta-lactamase class C family)
MQNRWPIFLALFFCLATASQGAAQKKEPAPLDLLVDEYLQARVKKDGFSGSVLIAKNGTPLFAKGYGLANHEHNIPNTTKTKFRIGSVSKPIAALIILMLVQQGILNLDDSVRLYVTDVPEAWEKVTIHHLLSHTGGVPEHTNQAAFGKQMSGPTTPRDTLRLVSSKPLDFTPGEKFKYTNTGYLLLGMVAEKVTKRRYAELVQEKICVPLGMKSTGYDEPGAILKDRASGYKRQGTDVTHAAHIHMSWPFAAGALYSTVEDLLRLDEALYSDKLLGAELRKKMFTPVRKEYAYGWSVRQRFGRPSVEHGGAIPGFRSSFMRFPDDHLFVGVLCNTEPIPAGDIAADLAGITLGVKGAGK